MSWKLDDSRPIYLQLADRLQSDIISGVYQPGDRLPSVRDLAADAAVNPNTMQKALSELETCGLLYTQRTSGRFITDDPDAIARLKEKLAVEQIRHFFLTMHEMGFSNTEILQYINEVIKEDTK